MLFRINAIISYKKGGWSSYAATLDSSGHKKYAGGGGPTKEDLREERELFSWPRFIETFPDAILPPAIDISHISDIKFSVGADGESSVLITENTGAVDDADIKANLVKFAYYTRQVYDPAKVTNSAGSSSINPNTAYNNTYNSLLGYIETEPDAPAGVEEAAYSPADISGILLWFDPSDASTITTASGTPGTHGEEITSIADKIATPGKVFSEISGYNTTYNPYTDATTGELGNGLSFIHAKYLAYAFAGFEFTPSGGDYNDVDTGGVNSEWTIFGVYFAETGFSWMINMGLVRGVYYADQAVSPSVMPWSSRWNIQTPWATSDVGHPTGSWADYDDPPWVSPSGRAQMHILQSTYIGGAWVLRVSQDGTNWNSQAHGETPGTVTATENKWQIVIRNWDPVANIGLGEMGFINGACSDATIQELHAYLKTKWDLYT